MIQIPGYNQGGPNTCALLKRNTRTLHHINFPIMDYVFFNYLKLQARTGFKCADSANIVAY